MAIRHAWMSLLSAALLPMVLGGWALQSAAPEAVEGGAPATATPEPATQAAATPEAAAPEAAIQAAATPEAAAAEAATPATAPAVDAVAIATQVLDAMDAGDFTAAAKDFSPEMRAAIGVDKLAAVQAQLEAAGPAKPRGAPKVSQVKGLTVVVFQIERGRTLLDAVVGVDAAGKVAGVQFTPPASPPAASVPTDARYGEHEVSVGKGAGALPGTLAMPGLVKGEKVPGVVLVHGSGPQDRNETIGPNRPFLDIARGLADKGIATLRYEKRTLAHPAEFSGDYGVDQETTDDAVAAVALLRATPGIDPDRIFVFGHSQGGLLAGRIAQRSGDLAGLVLLAAPARPILTLLSEQNHAMLAKAGPVSAGNQAALAELDAQIAAVRGTQPVANAASPMGLPAAYWRSIETVDAIADAKAANVPLLLLQGGRDMQVVDADWQLWKAALAGDDTATLKYYPALNHLGIAGVGEPSIKDYTVAGKVDDTLVSDVVAWVDAH